MTCDGRVTDARGESQTGALAQIISKNAAHSVLGYQTLPTRSKSSRQQNTEHGRQPARSNHTARLLGTDLARNRVKVTLALRCDPTPVRGKEGVSGEANPWALQRLSRRAPVQYALPSWLTVAAATPLPSWHVTSCRQPHPLPSCDAKAPAWLFPALGCCVQTLKGRAAPGQWLRRTPCGGPPCPPGCARRSSGPRAA